ncbi:hypothetical protein ES703_122811 [subsurface metagenome]
MPTTIQPIEHRISGTVTVGRYLPGMELLARQARPAQEVPLAHRDQRAHKVSQVPKVQLARGGHKESRVSQAMFCS